MTTEQKLQITATVPILKEHGVALTTYFYNRMFAGNPELKNVFNVGNQDNGKQQTALALAVLAYAEHINNPSVLMPVLDRIGHKHVSLDIRPEHYAIVGHHLLASIQEVLGDAATPEIMEAWGLAYNQLAGIMSNHEADLYHTQVTEPNGWSGWRAFVVKDKKQESAEIISFALYPADGGKVRLHHAGQYISIKVFLPELNLIQARQYSLSSVPNENYYRISVKRERGLEPDANGLISNYLHDFINEGDRLEITSPAGNFTLQKDTEHPVVFMSGGVGLTPFMSMLHHLVEEKSQRKISWFHGCRNKAVHAFEDDLNYLVAQNMNIEQFIFYSDGDRQNDHESIYQGYVDINQIPDLSLNPDAHYYICGPTPFINKQFADLKHAGIQKENIFFEEFGPQSLNFN